MDGRRVIVGMFSGRRRNLRMVVRARWWHRLYTTWYDPYGGGVVEPSAYSALECGGNDDGSVPLLLRR